MFNEYLLLQISLILVLFFIFWITDMYNLLVASIFYLIISCVLSLYNDVDILISFLIIIDLGVFLVLFSFLLHLNKFLTFKNIYDYSFKNLFITSLVVFFLLYFYLSINFTNIYNFNKIIEYTWFFFISYLDYYYIYNTIIYSDMHILKEIYFHINSLEFILISLFLFIGILTLYFLLNYLILFTLKFNTFTNKNLKYFNKNNSITFFKFQNYNKQVNTSASSRVWSKIKHDFKTDYINGNR